MKSQLCDMFNCTEKQLETKGILRRFHAWLKEHPELKPWDDPHGGEVINSDIAAKFFDFCKKGGKGE
jgi:hypothetical protein